VNASDTTLSWLSSSAKRLYAADSPRALAEAVIAAVTPRFLSSICGLEELGYDCCGYTMHGLRLTDPLPEDFAAYVHDHPGMARILGGVREGVMHLRAYAPPKVWERTDQYQGLARRMGWRDQLALVSYGPSSFASCSFWRDAPFREGERQEVALLQPHLDAAWRRLRAGAEHLRRVAWLPVEAGSTGFRIDPESSQHALLKAYFPDWRNSFRLPGDISRWLAQILAGLNSFPPAPPTPYRGNNDVGVLLLRAFPAAGPLGLRLRLTEFAPEGEARKSSALLTAREREVLSWIAEGKRDAEIASILGRAPATVSKHVERILTKLNVPTRLAAVRASADSREASLNLGGPS